MHAATDLDSVTAFVEQILAPSGWKIDTVKRRASRLDPPDTYWTQFEIAVDKGKRSRSLRMVAKGALNPPAWEKLSARLKRHGAGEGCDPINGIGYPQLFPETQHAYWFYPYDPTMPSLPRAADRVHMAALLLGLAHETRQTRSAARRLEIERVRYVPEVGAILRYTIDTQAGPMTVYGKVQPGDRGLRTYKVVEGLWRASRSYPGLLNLPRPLSYVEPMSLLLEEAVRGRPVDGNRLSTEFAMAGNAAAEALAVIHESGLDSDERIDIERELARLERVAQQFIYVLPQGHFLLMDLLAHMRERLRKTREEDWLPTHGDLKYDQFVHHNGEFTLLDFDYFALAETSYDLGKYCAYVIPSSPKDWKESVAAEATRDLFIRRYRELRPHATLQRFGVYEALQFALRAMSFMWAQTRGWDRIAETLLVMGFERLKTPIPD
jgi:hypothetical protein